MVFALAFIWAETPKAFFSGLQKTDNNDSTSLKEDNAPLDTIAKTTPEKIDTTATAEGPDTTKMDSLQLAIYHHNKAIDDSLAFDSINRKRKNGIDSPVEYTAEDSLTY